jgi:hypothetical protein
MSCADEQRDEETADDAGRASHEDAHVSRSFQLSVQQQSVAVAYEQEKITMVLGFLDKMMLRPSHDHPRQRCACERG